MLYAANSLWAFHHPESAEHYRMLRDLFIPLREKLSGEPSVALGAESDDFLTVDLSACANADLPGGLAGLSPAPDASFPVQFNPLVGGRCLQLRRPGEPVAQDEAALRRARAVARADAALPGVDEEQARQDLESPPADAATAITGIEVRGKFRSLVFLQTCVGHGRHGRTFSSIGRVADASEHIGSYRINYEDGQSCEVEIRYGQNVARPDLLLGASPESISYFAVPILYGKNGATRTLYAFEWVNPRPDAAIRSLDFAATKADTAAAPILVAITAVK